MVESARADWDAALGKFLRAKKVSKSALESPAMDAVMSLSRLELSRFDLISRLNLLEMSKRLELIERVCTALYSARAYFHQCNEVISELEPSMNDMLVRAGVVVPPGGAGGGGCVGVGWVGGGGGGGGCVCVCVCVWGG